MDELTRRVDDRYKRHVRWENAIIELHPTLIEKEYIIADMQKQINNDSMVIKGYQEVGVTLKKKA